METEEWKKWRNPSWANFGTLPDIKSEYPEAVKLGLVILKGEGADVAPAVVDFVGGLPEIDVESAAERLAELANRELPHHKTSIRAQTAGHPRGRGEPAIYIQSHHGRTHPMVSPSAFYYAIINTIQSWPSYVRLCPVCQSVFFPKSTRAVYCSNQCRALSNK